MPTQKITNEQVLRAASRLEAGEPQGNVARSYGVTARGLRLRLAALNLPGGKRGRPKYVPLNHCRTCRCRVPGATTTAAATEPEEGQDA